MAVTSNLTLEQFLRLEETEPASEYACGEAFQKPMPAARAARIQRARRRHLRADADEC